MSTQSKYNYLHNLAIVVYTIDVVVCECVFVISETSKPFWSKFPLVLLFIHLFGELQHVNFINFPSLELHIGFRIIYLQKDRNEDLFTQEKS